MKPRIPAPEDMGLESPVIAHFGSATLFVIVDAGSGVFRAVPSGNLHYATETRRPPRLYASERVDGIFVGGIGADAPAELPAPGPRGCITRGRTIGEAVFRLQDGRSGRGPADSGLRPPREWP